MLNLEINSKGFVFSVDYNGTNIPVSQWSETDDCIYYLPLVALVDNGFAEFSETQCIVDFDFIYQLDDSEKEILGIPDKYQKAMRLRGNGMLNSSDFRYQLDFISHVPDGELINCNRLENILYIIA